MFLRCPHPSAFSEAIERTEEMYSGNMWTNVRHLALCMMPKIAIHFRACPDQHTGPCVQIRTLQWQAVYNDALFETYMLTMR